MATWFRPTLSADERAAVPADRDAHADPVVRRKMHVRWAVHLGHGRANAARLAAFGLATAKRYVLADRDGGLDGLRRCDRHTPTSDQAGHAEVIRRSLTATPVRTVAEAADRIEEVTGLRRSLTQTRTFQAGLGFRWPRTRGGRGAGHLRRHG